MRTKRACEKSLSEMEVMSTEKATRNICIAAERVKRKRGLFSKISFKKGVERAEGLSSASPISRRKPTSLNWPNAISTVARNVSATSNRQVIPISISIKEVISRQLSVKALADDRRMICRLYAKSAAEAEFKAVHLPTIRFMVVPAQVQQAVQN